MKGSFLAFLLVAWTTRANAAVAPLSGPGSFDPSSTTITFEGYAHGTVANTLYSGLGVTFSRDDGQPVNIYNWSAIGRLTVSPSNVLATVSFLGASTFVTYLNASFANPVYQVGAWFGNDQGGADFGPDFTSMTFSAYGASGALLGQVNEAANNNTSVDQFIGLQSDEPIWSVRFQNMSSAGTPSTHFAVIIDNFEFSAVPEPSLPALLALGLLNLLCLRKRPQLRNSADRHCAQARPLVGICHRAAPRSSHSQRGSAMGGLDS